MIIRQELNKLGVLMAAVKSSDDKPTRHKLISQASAQTVKVLDMLCDRDCVAKEFGLKTATDKLNEWLYGDTINARNTPR